MGTSGDKVLFSDICDGLTKGCPENFHNILLLGWRFYRIVLLAWENGRFDSCMGSRGCLQPIHHHLGSALLNTDELFNNRKKERKKKVHQ